jgi:hypothetical protein
MIYCDKVDNWKQFNHQDFDDINGLYVFDLNESDSLNFDIFSRITTLSLIDVKFSAPFLLYKAFPELEVLKVYNTRFSNVSYLGIQNLENLYELRIEDRFFKRTAELSAIRNLKLLEIGDGATLSFFNDHLNKLLTHDLDVLFIDYWISRKCNNFLNDYFSVFKCRKLIVQRLNRFKLKGSYNFEVLMTDRFPDLDDIPEDRDKKVIIDKYRISFKKDIEIIEEISNYYLTDIYITSGIQDCPTPEMQSINSKRLRYFVVGDRIVIDCNGFTYTRINTKQLKDRYLD